MDSQPAPVNDYTDEAKSRKRMKVLFQMGMNITLLVIIMFLIGYLYMNSRKCSIAQKVKDTAADVMNGGGIYQTAGGVIMSPSYSPDNLDDVPTEYSLLN